jgi:DNA-binding response OmpR family regulator
MKPGRTAHIVVVAVGDQAIALTVSLRRMEMGEITTVGRMDEARQLCRAGRIDACIVAVGDAPDACPTLQEDAPGRGCGVPTLLLVAAVSPGLRKLARRAGYKAVIPAALPPRLLYRRIRAALQQRSTGGKPRRRRRTTIIALPIVLAKAMPGKTTLH